MRPPAIVACCLLASCTGPGLSPELCGGPDEPCCETRDAPCDVGATCGSSGICLVCGGLGQPCCGADCAAGLECRTGSCASPPAPPVTPVTCEVDCAFGSRRCREGALEACVPKGVCPAWSALVEACPGGSVCQEEGATADCVELCPGACAPGALECGSNGLHRCVLDDGAKCPRRVPETDDLDRPRCAASAAVGAEVVWESPTPFGAPLKAIAGYLGTSYWAMDDLGNIVRNAEHAWRYEARASDAPRMQALGFCLGSMLAAVGQQGAVQLRRSGAWRSESVGADANLVAVTCDATYVLALSDDGRLFMRSLSGAWTAIDVGSADGRAVGFDYGRQQAIIVGRGGSAVLCRGMDDPATATCAPETTGATQDLHAVWVSTAGLTFAVGDAGALLVRGAAGGWSSRPSGTGVALRAIDGMETETRGPLVVAVGDAGAYVVIEREVAFPSTVADEHLTSVFVAGDDLAILGGAKGGLWATLTLFPGPTTPFLPLGGHTPIEASLNAVVSTGPGELFAVGDRGARYRRVGPFWKADSGGVRVASDLFAVTATSPRELYAVGAEGTILVRRQGEWRDDGPVPTTATLRGVAHDAQNVWAVGEDDAGRAVWLEKKASEGAWKTLALPENLGGLRGLSARYAGGDRRGAAEEVVAVGAGCSIVSWRGGALVVETAQGCADELHAVTFNEDGTELFAGGANGTLLRRTAGGWMREYAQPVPIQVRGLAAGRGSIWVVGAGGTIYRRTSAWVPVATKVTSRDLLGVARDPESGVFVVGEQGVVLRLP